MVRIDLKMTGDVVDSAFAGVQFPVVAGQTKRHRFSNEQTLHLGTVGIVAIQARPTGGDGIVGDGDLFQQFLDGVVTIQTQLRRGLADELLVIRAVRDVARAAGAIAYRLVQVNAPIKRLPVALCAELASGIDAEQGSTLGPMWVVAKDAYPHLHRLVDEPLPGKAVVAGVAQFGIVARPFEFVAQPGLKRSGPLLGHMTSVALVFRHWFVETFVLPD